jgi:hypothetical protein
MGCTNNRNIKKYKQEKNITKWEKDLAFRKHDFSSLITEMNYKLFLEGEKILKEKFDKFFYLKIFERNSNVLFKQNYLKVIIHSKTYYDCSKIKFLLLLLTTSKITETNNKIYSDKAEYIISYLKEHENADLDLITQDNHILEELLQMLIYMSCVFLPELYIKSKHDKILNEEKYLEALIRHEKNILEKLKEELFLDSNNNLTIENLSMKFMDNPYVKIYIYLF